MSLNIQSNPFVNNSFDASVIPQAATASRPVHLNTVDGQIDLKNVAPETAPASEAAGKSESKGFWGSLWGGVKSIGHGITKLGNGLKDFGSSLWGGLKSIGHGIKNAGSKFMDGAMWAGGKLGDGFMAFMKGGAWVAGKMREGVIAGAKAVGGFFKQVGEGFGSFFKHPLDAIKGFGSGIKALGSKAWNGLLGLGGKMGDGFMSFMKGGAWVAGKMREGVVKAADAIGSAAKKVGSFIKGLF